MNICGCIFEQRAPSLYIQHGSPLWASRDSATKLSDGPKAQKLNCPNQMSITGACGAHRARSAHPREKKSWTLRARCQRNLCLKGADKKSTLHLLTLVVATFGCRGGKYDDKCGWVRAKMTCHGVITHSESNLKDLAVKYDLHLAGHVFQRKSRQYGIWYCCLDHPSFNENSKECKKI